MGAGGGGVHMDQVEKDVVDKLVTLSTACKKVGPI